MNNLGTRSANYSNDNMSRCASALLRASKELTSFYDDPISIHYGFECADLACCAWDDKVMDILSYWGYHSGDEFMDDFRGRTSDKCAYNFSFLTGEH